MRVYISLFCLGLLAGGDRISQCEVALRLPAVGLAHLPSLSIRPWILGGGRGGDPCWRIPDQSKALILGLADGFFSLPLYFQPLNSAERRTLRPNR